MPLHNVLRCDVAQKGLKSHLFASGSYSLHRTHLKCGIHVTDCKPDISSNFVPVSMVTYSGINHFVPISGLFIADMWQGMDAYGK